MDSDQDMEVDPELDTDPPDPPVPPDDSLPTPAEEQELLQGGENWVSNQAYQQDSTNQNSQAKMEDQELTTQGPPTQLIFKNSTLIEGKIIQTSNSVKKGADSIHLTPHTVRIITGANPGINPFTNEEEPEHSSPSSPSDIQITEMIDAESSSPEMDKEDEARSRRNSYSDDLNIVRDIRYDTNSKYYVGDQTTSKPSNSPSTSSDSALEANKLTKEEKRRLKNKNARKRKRQKVKEEKLARKEASPSNVSPIVPNSKIQNSGDGTRKGGRAAPKPKGSGEAPTQALNHPPSSGKRKRDQAEPEPTARNQPSTSSPHQHNSNTSAEGGSLLIVRNDWQRIQPAELHHLLGLTARKMKGIRESTGKMPMVRSLGSALADKTITIKCADQETIDFYKKLAEDASGPPGMGNHPGYSVQAPGDRPPYRVYGAWFPGDCRDTFEMVPEFLDLSTNGVLTGRNVRFLGAEPVSDGHFMVFFALTPEAEDYVRSPEVVRNGLMAAGHRMKLIAESSIRVRLRPHVIRTDQPQTTSTDTVPGSSNGTQGVGDRAYSQALTYSRGNRGRGRGGRSVHNRGARAGTTITDNTGTSRFRPAPTVSRTGTEHSSEQVRESTEGSGDTRSRMNVSPRRALRAPTPTFPVDSTDPNQDQPGPDGGK